MIELAFVVCLRLDPMACEQKVLPLFTEVSSMQCMIGAQAVLAQWSEQYPQYRIAGWTCRHQAEMAEKA